MAKSYKRIEKIIRKIFPDYSGLKDDFIGRGFSDELRSVVDEGINASKYHMVSIEAYAIISILGSIIIDHYSISFEGINLKKIIKGANEILQEEKISLEIDISDELIELLTHLLIDNYCDSLKIEIDHICNCEYCNCSMEETEVGLCNLIEDYEGENLLDKIEYININK